MTLECSTTSQTTRDRRSLHEVDMRHRAEALARRFHETYERLAPSHGYETRKESAVAWENVPEQNKSLMIAVCAELLPHIVRFSDSPSGSVESKETP